MPQPVPDIHGYRFDDVEIDLRRRELRVDGAIATVEPRVFDLIVTLIEGRDRAFGKDDLIRALWARPVSDASLSQLVYKARRALREDEQRRFIETVHGHGFRWLVEVRPLAGKVVALPAARPLRLVAPQADAPDSHVPPAPASHRATTRAWMRPWLATAVLALVVLLAGGLALRHWWPASAPAQREVLVLPVDDATGESALAWVRDGLPGLVVSVLDQMPGLRGVGSREALGNTSGAADAAQRRRLRLAAGTDQIASMRLSRAGPLLRLDLVLEGESGRNSVALFGAEAAPLALDAARRIGEWLGGTGAAQPAAVGGPDGYFAETYARGIEAFVNGRIEVARNHFAICVERRPDLAWPRLQLAAAEVHLGHNAAALHLLADLEQQAGALAPAQARHLRLRLADARLGAGDTEAARRGYDALRAEAEAAGDSLLLRFAWAGLGRAEAAMGRHAVAAQWLQRVVDFDRRNGDRRREALALADLAALAFLQGDLLAAEQGLLRAGDLARQQNLPALQQRSLSGLAGIKLTQGRHVEALDLYLQALPLARQQGDVAAEVVIRAGIAGVYAAFGRADPAERHARRALDLARDNGLVTEEAQALGASARAAAAAGDSAQALRLHGEAAERFERARNWPLAAAQRLLLARRARLHGDTALLARQVEAVEALAREHADSPDLVVLARAVRAQQQLQRGEPAALATLEQARAGTNSPPAGLRWRRLLTIEVGRFALTQGDVPHAGSVLNELDPAHSDDPDVLHLQRQWLLASDRSDVAAQVQARLDRLAAALPDPREDDTDSSNQ
ncbi:MAG: tetratricopeptide repeat protein [Rhodanobacteraceae bacterium]|jgi:DNA-binding winged helix-turn-helix (wHTH) protein/tetratricopeptide (TPR) repeat protein|nr:tetratricopeptide repeat protein [Rhodanobacteraceae bacterium]